MATSTKECLKSSVIREMQIQSIMRYHFSPTRMAKIRETGKSRCWGGCEEVGILIYCWWEYEMMYLLYKTAWQFLKVLNTELLCDPAIILINTYARKVRKHTHRNFCVNTISVIHQSQEKNGNNQMSISWWMDIKIWYIIQWNNQHNKEVLIYSTTWMNFWNHYAKWKSPVRKGHRIFCLY